MDIPKRMLDFVGALTLICLLSPLILCIAILIKLTSEGPVIYWSDRVGLHSSIFRMPKFRTMKMNTPEVATDRLKNSGDYITKVGKFLRKTSLDELPQLYSVIVGHMSFVGPRPALYNQYELIEKRKKLRVDRVKPGVTGLAQVNGRDALSDDQKVELDARYIERMGLLMDLSIIIKTVAQALFGKNILH